MYKILLAEDDSAMRFVYSKMNEFVIEGFKITKEVTNGKSALEALEKEHFDLLLTDIRMPFMDGTELLKEIKERKIDVSVIFVSSYDDFEYVRQGIVYGAVDYILKPVDSENLKSALRRVRKKLESKKPSSTLSQEVLKALESINICGDENGFVKQVCEFLSENKNLEMTMEEISANFNLSKDYFGKLFKKNFGVTFNRFFTLVKIEYAKELLLSGGYKTYQVAEILGYSGADYFTKVFREVTGKTPSEFKSEM